MPQHLPFGGLGPLPHRGLQTLDGEVLEAVHTEVGGEVCKGVLIGHQLRAGGDVDTHVARVADGGRRHPEMYLG